ncbi:hypothetical protein RCH18_000385 [Flavobacterium sp. PL11]|jgi:hypothetical protein|uniref:hypothetical protein n=1 Tax=Flavobacterium sp. PL11 TaxID=3071717 RepID=UPI002E02256E|nr:hypothetical protein [Flavobacterium sp. PL11]
MTRIKQIILLLILVLGFQSSFGQTYKFKTSSFSVLEKNEKGKWGKWSDLSLADILVSLDTDKSRIIIYSQIIQLFDIVTYQPIEENESDIVYSFTCIDNEGTNCTVSIVTRKKQENRKQLYINYGNRIINYNIFSML